MNDLDLGSLELILSQDDLKLRWHIGQSAAGNERLDDAPKKANFHWIRDELQVHSIEVTRDELGKLIQSLEGRGSKVPDEFHEALEELPA